MPVTTNQRTSRCLFKWSADYGLDSNGKLWGLSGNRVVTATFDRGGTAGAASAVDANSREFIAGYKTPRWHYVGGTRYLLLEGSRQNKATYSSDMTNAAWTANQFAVTPTADQATAPDGTVTADSLVETTANSEHYTANAPTTTAALWTFSVFYKPMAGCTRNIALYHSITNKGKQFTPAGAGMASAFSDPPSWNIVTAVNGWFRAWCSFNATAAANDFRLWYASGTTLSYVGDAAQGYYLRGGQVELGAFPSSFIPTGASAVTRSADACSATYSAAPQAATYYVKFVELTPVALSNSERVLSIGNGTNARLEIYRNSTGYTALLHNGTTSVTATCTCAATYGDLVQLRLTMTSAGVLTLSSSLNSAAESSGSASSALTLPTAWNAATITFGGDGAGTNLGYAGFGSVKGFAGSSVSLATCQAA